MARFSVVVCSYSLHRWSGLLAAMFSLSGQRLPPSEIIIVVDHNPELLLRARADVEGAVVVENTGRPGLAGSRNSGISAAEGEIIAFLDDDAVADPRWLEWLTKGFEDQRVLGVGGSVEPVWNSGRPRWFPEEFDWVVGCAYRGLPQTTAPVRNPIGANMSFRRELFDSVGGFREDMGRVGTVPLGDEETELCIRAAQRWPESIFLFEPRARVLHAVPPERARWSYFQSRCYAEGVSKARLSRVAGTANALVSERKHAVRTLPTGVLKGVADAVLRSDGGGVLRALAIVHGLAATTAGYVAGALAVRWSGLSGRNGEPVVGSTRREMP